ncbi:MAG: hypothetical protein MRY83_13385 [Flavobacteriales bacterium]|nr:hypothetical protein [Flavobacteriales bacterium]
MKLFIGILFAAAILGGLAGGEISSTSFSVLGMIIGGVGTAAVLLGLGAYFDKQANKQADLPDDVRDIFDRMITGKDNPTQEEVLKAKQLHQKSVGKSASSPTHSSNQFKNTLAALENLKPQYKSNDVYATGAVDASFIAAKQSVKLDKKEILSDNRDPYDIALTTLWNISNQEVSTGHNHVYRGVLSGNGTGYLFVFNKTVDILLEKGLIDENEAISNRAAVRANIKAAG